MACRPTAKEKYGYEDSRFEKDIDAHFHCSICYNVLKEPMMCRNNEHVFCRACITEHLNVNSQTCPECNEHLTVETLRRGPRLVLNYLSELKIKCEYSSRGCLELTRLEELDAHVEDCDFAPVKCSNEGCEMVISKREQIHHETTICENRKVKCHSCEKLENDVEEMKKKMENNEGKVDQLKALIVQMVEKFRVLENTMQIASAINQASNALMGDIFVAGGFDERGHVLKSTERFSWKKKVWESVSPMNVGRKGATSFVYENQLFVAGGCDNTTLEVSNLNEDLLQWDESMDTLPHACDRLRCVVYQNRAILFCACDDISSMGNCAELSLAAPYTCNQLCEIPEPRKEYTVVAFEHKVLIFGGKNDINGHYFDSVSEFDINTNQFKALPSLPHSFAYMTAVRWGDHAILVGGYNKKGKSKKVIMYDSKTGNTTIMPSMLKERSGCCAVITGNTIVVMGGVGNDKIRVRSVEAFTMGGYSWRYLPAMNDIRSGATATVVPAKH